jgi:hypothetical protein
LTLARKRRGFVERAGRIPIDVSCPKAIPPFGKTTNGLMPNAEIRCGGLPVRTRYRPLVLDTSRDPSAARASAKGEGMPVAKTVNAPDAGSTRRIRFRAPRSATRSAPSFVASSCAGLSSA